VSSEPKRPDKFYRNLALGFFPTKGDNVPQNLRDLLNGSDWEQMFAVFMLFQQGDFSHLSRIHQIMMRNNETLIWNAGVNIIGFTGGWKNIINSFELFRSRMNEFSVRYYMAILLGCSCDIRAVPSLLEIYALCTNPDEDYDQTLRELSFLLETNDREIFDLRHDLPSHQSLVELVKPYQLSVSEAVDGSKTFEAQPYDVVRLAERLLDRLEAEDARTERFYRGRLVFEAATGVNCTGFFDDKFRLDRLAAMGILEEFLESEQLNRFIPGKRYFFGQPIPD
jgi:hypothetical protein